MAASQPRPAGSGYEYEFPIKVVDREGKEGSNFVDLFKRDHFVLRRPHLPQRAIMKPVNRAIPGDTRKQRRRIVVETQRHDKAIQPMQPKYRCNARIRPIQIRIRSRLFRRQCHHAIDQRVQMQQIRLH